MDDFEDPGDAELYPGDEYMEFYEGEDYNIWEENQLAQEHVESDWTEGDLDDSRLDESDPDESGSDDLPF